VGEGGVKGGKGKEREEGGAPRREGKGGGEGGEERSGSFSFRNRSLSIGIQNRNVESRILCRMPFLTQPSPFPGLGLAPIMVEAGAPTYQINNISIAPTILALNLVKVLFFGLNEDIFVLVHRSYAVRAECGA
jgi:hypothetical protein